MLVTINTDASFYSEHKQGGYAFWIKSNLATVKYAAAFKNEIASSHDAEFKCLINALYKLKSLGWTITEIYVNTDSQNMIDAIEDKDGKNKTNQTQHGQENINLYKAITTGLKCPISLRKVQGHTHTKTARNWVNFWCDCQAKIAIRKKLFGPKDKLAIKLQNQLSKK